MWPERVIARIEGGLGNQLFQYATARTLADRLDCELTLDLRGLEENGDRPFQLDHYRIRAAVASSEELAELPEWRASRWRRMRSSFSQWVPLLSSYPVFWPRGFAFDRRFECISRPAYLVGYWQTEKYFVWNRSRLLQDIQLVTPLPPHTPLLDEIRAANSVALHIRRGDYVSNPAAAKFHGLCDLTYYHAAINLLKNRFKDIQIVVFSDEPAWACDNLHLELPTIFVDANPPDSGHLDLELMRHCRHHVVANSSFSWWGAWLCERAGQMVCAPRRWFADPRTDISDVVPASWIQL